jgi:hypothetical protein
MALPTQRASQPATPAAPPKPSRMTLANIVRGPQAAPVRALLYGVEGVGKTTFGANAPSPIFVGAEDGTGSMDVARYPQPETFTEAVEAVRDLTVSAHPFETLVIDSLDWLEPLVWAEVCRKGQKANIEDFGFGKGYIAAVDEWRVLLAALEGLRKAKRMHIVLLAHSWLKTFKNPTDEDFDRYEMKLHNKAAGLLREWVDAVLFANYETIATKNEKTKRVRGVSTGVRLLHTTHSAAWDAKNRYSLPERMALSWPEFFAAVRAGQVADPAKIKEEIVALSHDAGEWGTQALEAMDRAGMDAGRLAQLLNWLQTKVEVAK